MADQRDPTQRFSDRVENYARYRPGYPAQVYPYLQQAAWLQSSAVIADLGSGTGLLSRLFLEYGHRLFAVEPNAEMRQAAEEQFASQPGFVSVAGRAEATTLPSASVDLVAAGQAFHWFEPQAAKAEMRRILRPGGQVALIWNQRHTQASAFMLASEQLLEEYGTDFKQVDQQRTITDEKIAEFYSPNQMKKAWLPNRQVLDARGLRGRLLSSSYTPTPADPRYAPMLVALDEIFSRFQQDGEVEFTYRTVIYTGLLAA